MRNSLLLVIVLLATSACSTTPVNYRLAGPLQSEHIYNDSYLVREEGKVAVNFVRDKGFTGAGCTHTVFVDNNRVFAIDQGESATVYLEPGNHFFRLDLGAGLCPNESYSEATYIKAGEPQTFRILTSSNFNIMLTRIE